MLKSVVISFKLKIVCGYMCPFVPTLLTDVRLKSMHIGQYIAASKASVQIKYSMKEGLLL